MKATTIFSTLTVLSSVAISSAVAQSKRFNLVASAFSNQPNVVLKGPWLSAFHVGAGQNTIVTVADRAQAATWYIEDEALVQDLPSPNVFGLSPEQPYLSDAPEGYKYVELDAGDASAGQKPWSYNEETKRVLLTTPDGFFSVCNVNGTAPFFELGPQSQLLWRSLSTSVPDPRDPPRCADVGFYAVDIEEY